jgi:hypothetical protein
MKPESCRTHGARTSLTARLLQAVLMGLVLVPLGTVAVETAPTSITCGFGGYYGSGSEGCTPLAGGEGTQTARFGWGDYFFDLTLFDPQGDFEITLTDNPMSQSEFKSRLGHEDFGDFSVQSHLPTSYRCIPMVGGRGQTCRDFYVEAPDREAIPEFHWDKYEFTIDWDWISPESASDRRHTVLHDIGGTISDHYDEDMCLQADLGVPGYRPCEYSPFPFIRSGDTDFQSFTAAVTTVPEPGLLSLFGASAIALWYRGGRRRRSEKS